MAMDADRGVAMRKEPSPVGMIGWRLRDAVLMSSHLSCFADRKDSEYQGR